VKFRRIAPLRGPGCSILARFTTGSAALLDCTPGGGRALVLASDLDNEWNDFPLHASFVPFLHSAVQYLAAGRPPGGEYLVAETPAGIPAVPGIAMLPGAADRRLPPRRVAVNVDPAESDPARLTVEQFQTAVMHLKDADRAEQRLEARQEEERQHIWRYLLALMAALLALESVVAARTV
jgi:hypothetical protein